jgi:F-type H+-transporting ATPase subunit alpha
VEDQIIYLYVAMNGYLMEIPVKEVQKFNANVLDHVKTKYSQVLESIRQTGELKPDMEDVLKQAIKECLSNRA